VFGFMGNRYEGRGGATTYGTKTMNEITAKRLTVIRHLFEKGKALSLEGEPMNGLCLLSSMIA